MNETTTLLELARDDPIKAALMCRLECKIACNNDPLRGCFASNNDPL
jgi:hypothetical protein